VYVFISYAHEDWALVDQMCERFTSSGLEFFHDKKDIRWGGHISSEVQQALERAGGVVVVVSPASVKSQWVPYEVGYATALRKVILPYLTHPSIDLPGYLAGLRYITDLDAIGAFIGQVLAIGESTVVSAPGEFSDAVRAVSVLSGIAPQMPDLLSEMREDVRNDETGLVADFLLLSIPDVAYQYPKAHFMYYESDHPNLRLKVDKLKDVGLIVELTSGNMLIYRMMPQFAAALRGTA